MTGEAEAFIARWQGSGGQERANAQPFLIDLCTLIDVAPPLPATPDYGFEHPVHRVEGDGSTWNGFIDLYRRGAFVLEAKQGISQAEPDEASLSGAPLSGAPLSGAPSRRRGGHHGVRGTARHHATMVGARLQAEQYARAVAAGHGWPLFLIVVDVGHAVELYADFTRTGTSYVQFPDTNSFRITLNQLADPLVRERLRQVWQDPAALDPARHAARVTREIASRLARLGERLEARHDPRPVAEFLTRCLFTMFAEDVGLIPASCFSTLLAEIAPTPEKFQPLVSGLWADMRTGSRFSAVAREPILHFNGGLFDSAQALDLKADEIALLAEAAAHDWRDVEPAIFGTLLERALSTTDRHKLGAHYTPRAYVERLVLPTVIEPLRHEWVTVQAAAEQARAEGDAAGAVAEVAAFRDRLCAVRVLDPACGSGNFLYVTMEHMKRLEGEVLDLLVRLGAQQTELALADRSVGPHQFLGIEVNPRAAALAELVLWIGHLQWHMRTRGRTMPAEPVLQRHNTITCRDAVLAWDGTELLRDDAGQILSRWDGVTTRVHPVTAKQVPDEAARVEVLHYHNPRPAPWPQADYIIGNPPFIGTWKLRQTLGDGYAEALRAAYPEVPDSADYVTYWWHRAAEAVGRGQARRLGLITTNSLRQTFSRRVLAHHLEGKQPLSLAFAIADHPWIDAADGAAVRIAMTVALPGTTPGRLLHVTNETTGADGEVAVELAEQTGRIQADLSIGAEIAKTVALKANGQICSPGVKLNGAGFLIKPEEAYHLGIGQIPELDRHIKHYRNGRDLTARSRNLMVIDLYGLSEAEVRQQFPEVYQHVLMNVKPEREINNESNRRDYWWLLGRQRPDLRSALAGLPRYIATVETSKHRFFQFLDGAILPDNMLVNIALADALHLAILSSTIHVTWALAQGGRLGVGNDPRYNKSRCFDTFPFPVCTEAQAQRLRALGEELDAHRKARLAAEPRLTMTGLYNVMARLAAGEALEPAERAIHDAGLVGVLAEIHRALDAATAEAYGWPTGLEAAEVLHRLVALNRARLAEERQGLIRHLRPDYQASTTAVQTTLGVETEEVAPLTTPTIRPWPRDRLEQLQAVRAALAEAEEPLALPSLTRRFKGARTPRISELLTTLTTLGLARTTTEGRFAG